MAHPWPLLRRPPMAPAVVMVLVCGASSSSPPAANMPESSSAGLQLATGAAADLDRYVGVGHPMVLVTHMGGGYRVKLRSEMGGRSGGDGFQPLWGRVRFPTPHHVSHPLPSVAIRPALAASIFFNMNTKTSRMAFNKMLVLSKL